MSWFRRDSRAAEHRYVQERLSAYLDRELSSPEHGRVERHLHTCAQCRCDLDNVRRTVQWTMELPAVPCPRAFTVPVPVLAQRARSGQRVWSLPLLQGATALVAVLFLLAVAGDAFLPGMLPASAPAPAVFEREAVSLAQPTQAAVSDQQSVEVTVVVEVAVPAPQETPAPEAEALSAKAAQDAAAAATAAPAGMGAGIGGPEALVTEVVEATTPPPSSLVGISASLQLTATATSVPTVTPEPSLAPAPTMTATAEPSPTALPSLAAMLLPTSAPEADVVAAAEAPFESSSAAPAPRPSETSRNPGLRWWLIGEIVLGVAFVVLGTLTVILTVRRLAKT